jgi:hypothetical protein
MTVMDLVAGDEREILLTLAVDDWDAIADERRFDGYLSLGSGLDPTWLDELSRAIRDVTEADEPADFLDARAELVDAPTERTVERVDPAWIEAIARLDDRTLRRVTTRWIDRMEAEGDEVPADERETLYALAADLVRFCRSAAESGSAVVFAWSL